MCVISVCVCVCVCVISVCVCVCVCVCKREHACLELAHLDMDEQRS